jgi:hypothetical protein
MCVVCCSSFFTFYPITRVHCALRTAYWHWLRLESRAQTAAAARKERHYCVAERRAGKGVQPTHWGGRGGKLPPALRPLPDRSGHHPLT